MPLITLVGYRGTGKSTVAALLAERLGSGWFDADEALEARLGVTIATLVRERGEQAFRDAESALLAETLPHWSGVFSTGGGVVLRQENRDLLRSHGRPVVWLTADAGIIRRRLAADPGTDARRPALSGAHPLDEVDAALVERRPLYRQVADTALDTGSTEPPELARRIADWLAAGAPAGGLEGCSW